MNLVALGSSAFPRRGPATECPASGARARHLQARRFYLTRQALLLAIYLLCAQLTGKLRKLPTSRYVVGFCAHGLLATLCLWLGRNKTLAPFGISYAVYAIFLGKG